MKRSLAALAVVVALTGCSAVNDAVDDAQRQANSAATKAGQLTEAAKAVNWDQYPQQTQRRIQRYVARDNCHGLNRELTALDPGQDGELISYLKQVVASLGCS